jgi:hypothetical protein
MNIRGPPVIMVMGMSGLAVSMHANGLGILVASDLKEYWWSSGCSGVPPELNLRFILILTRGEKYGWV